MKRMLGALVLAVFLVVPVGAVASQSAGGGPSYDKVDGTLEDTGPTTLHVNAFSDANGANPGGHFWYRSQQTNFIFDEVGHVTCLNVFAPDRAWVGGYIDRSKMPGFPGEGNGFLFLIVDTGEPADANPLMPDSHADFFLANPPTVCPTGGVFYFPYKSGNFVVNQAP
jgi:hypothetical protein